MDNNNPKLLSFFILTAFLIIFGAGCVEDNGGNMISGEEVDLEGGDEPAITEPIGGLERLSTDFLSSGISSGGGFDSGSNAISSRGIVVSGEGKIKIIPDMAVLTIGVVTTAESSREAIGENSEIMDSVIEAIKSNGVAERDIKTQSVNVWPQFDYGGREEAELPVIIGYRAENSVRVSIRDIDRTGEIIDAATLEGANQLYGLSFTVSEESSKNLQEELLKAAVLDASQKAIAIAEAIKVENLRPVSVVESRGYSPPIYRYDLAAVEKAGAETPISPGETEVSALITMTFEFE